MKYLILLGLLVSSQAFAQYSVVEYEADSRFRLMGLQWTPSFFSLASIEPEKVENEGGRIGSYNYFTMAAWVGDNLRFKLRAPFTYGTAGTDRFNGRKQNGQEFEFQDIILNLSSADFWILPFDIGTYWEGRLYLPTSTHSRDSGKITSLRNELIFTKMFTRYWGLEYDQKLVYHMQSRTAYQNTFVNENGFTQTSASVTKKFETDHWINLWYKTSTDVALGWRLGGEDSWWHKSEAEGKTKPGEHLIKTGPSVRFSLSKKANFLLGYDDKVPYTNRRELGKFLAKNTQVTLLSFISF